jgi:hypothetical protein
MADYDIQLVSVERPESAKERYGEMTIDSVANDTTYRFMFEDSLVKILWIATSRRIAFHLFNKTNHSIKIPWDEAAFVDENGSTHRVMHSGIRYNERESPQPASVVVRKGSIQDIVFPTDYVYFESGKYGGWKENPLFEDLDYHFQSGYSHLNSGKYASLEQFTQVANSNVGKSYQVLLPIKIEDVVNDYIFTFEVKGVRTRQKM